jgi:hypothetical protein
MRNTIALTAISLFAAGCLTAVQPSGIPTASTNNAAFAVTGKAPLDITVGHEYQFTPTVSDLDGNTLTFSISGLPRWASFDASTGELSGSPKSGDVGTSSNIIISATDGADSVSIGPFAIIVSDTTYGSVTLSWTAPTQNEDGSTLTDLDGYRLYWFKTSGNYSDSVTIDNESVTTFLIESIPSGTYEFFATSFNTAGIESRYSSPATKVVPQ